MEFLSRRKWRLISAKLSIKFGFCPWCPVSIVLYFHKQISLPYNLHLPLAPIGIFITPSTYVFLYVVPNVVMKCCTRHGAIYLSIWSANSSTSLSLITSSLSSLFDKQRFGWRQIATFVILAKPVFFVHSYSRFGLILELFLYSGGVIT